MQILSLLPEIWITSEGVPEKECWIPLFEGRMIFYQKNKIKLLEQTSQKTSFNALKATNGSSHMMKFFFQLNESNGKENPHGVWHCNRGQCKPSFATFITRLEIPILMKLIIRQNPTPLSLQHPHLVNRDLPNGY